MLPVFSRWCRRYAAHFTAFGAAFYTTARVNAARFSAVGVGVMLPILLLLDRFLHYGEGKCCGFFSRGRRRHAAHFTAVGAAFYTTATVNAGHFLAVSVGVMPPILLLLVRPFTLRRG